MRSPHKFFLAAIAVLLAATCEPKAQTVEDGIKRNVVGQILPGKGLAQHDFLMVGEHSRDPGPIMSVVRGGKVVWSYVLPFQDAQGRNQQFGDAHMRPNGNIVFSRAKGASEITPEKKIIWNVDAAPDTEIHSVEPIGDDRTLMVINGNGMTVRLLNIKTGKVEKELILPTEKPKAHWQCRQVVLTESGNPLVGRLDTNTIAEYDWDGKELWSVPVKTPWAVQRLANGNTLTASNQDGRVLEFNPKGEIVWEFTQKDVSDIKLYNLQSAIRLADGNTIIANWCCHEIENKAEWNGSVQLIEVTSDKKVVWALSQWSDPYLGPATRIQLLDEPSIDNEDGFLKYYPTES